MEIQRQTIKGSIYTYIGVFLGFVINVFIFAKLLKTEEIGFLKLLVHFVLIFSNVAALGFNSVITRLFTYFRDKEKNHNGFLFLTFFVIFIGFLLFLIIFIFLKPILLENYSDADLFIKYIDFIIPFTFFYLIFTVLDTYNKVLYDIILGIFFKEIFIRILVLISVVLYFFSYINFHQFVIFYVISFCSPAVFIILVLIYRREFNLFPRLDFLTKEMKKNMFSVSVFGLITGLSAMAISSIDTLMLASIVDLQNLGIYNICFYFGTIILIPSRALLKITSAVIADLWKKNDIESIKIIYQKTCINQTLVALLFFVGIWGNVDNIFRILEGFESGKYVIFFISVANLIAMIAGTNGVIIDTSKYYKVHTYLILMFVGIIIITNYIFIPIYGIVGAAFASMISTLFFNFSKYLFLHIKFNMKVFNYKYIILFSIAFFSYFAVFFIKSFENLYFDIFIRSSIIFIIYLSAVYFFRISDDINKKISYFFIKLKKII